MNATIKTQETTGCCQLELPVRDSPLTGTARIHSTLFTSRTPIMVIIMTGMQSFYSIHLGSSFARGFRYFCRGTDKFQILVWNEDQNIWEVILNDRVESSVGKNCESPVEIFRLSGQQTKRLVKFVVKTVFGFGGGLQFLDFVFDDAEPRGMNDYFCFNHFTQILVSIKDGQWMLKT